MMVTRKPIEEFLKDTKAYYSEDVLHSYGVYLLARLLAHVRNLDPTLAGLAGLFHDYGKILDGIDNPSHARHSAVRAGQALNSQRDTHPLSVCDQNTIIQSITHHMEKDMLHSPYDELLKDADVLEKFLAQTNKNWTDIHKKRMESLLLELHISEISPKEAKHEHQGRDNQ